MTDKQMIIDGKECRYWFRPNPDDYRKCSLRGKNDNCDEITDCFIKELLGKLALKEQECEELKEDRERWKSNFNGKVSAIEELLQQLDQLKAYIKEDLIPHAKLYKQTLAEIKEICNNNDELQVDFNLVDCDKYKLGKHNLANKILQKISKCEVE